MYIAIIFNLVRGARWSRKVRIPTLIHLGNPKRISKQKKRPTANQTRTTQQQKMLNQSDRQVQDPKSPGLLRANQSLPRRRRLPTRNVWRQKKPKPGYRTA